MVLRQLAPFNVDHQVYEAGDMAQRHAQIARNGVREGVFERTGKNGGWFTSRLEKSLWLMFSGCTQTAVTWREFKKPVF